MAYERQNFQDGNVLTAAELNHIEDGIVDVQSLADDALTPETGVMVAEQELTDAQKTQVRENIGAVKATINGTILVIS